MHVEAGAVVPHERFDFIRVSVRRSDLDFGLPLANLTALGAKFKRASFPRSRI
jgi:hypothetical protein